MQRRLRRIVLPASAALALIMLVAPDVARCAAELRLRDIARIQEVRPNKLEGTGLVVGLNGSGDGGELAKQLAKNYLEKHHIKISQDDLDSNNLAAVIVTCEVPAFSVEGSKLDVTVSSIGKASSLSGGTLIQTPLQGPDGVIYAVAQGPVAVGGYAASGEAAGVTKNIPTVARIPGGAMIEKTIPTSIRPNEPLHLALNTPDIGTAVRVADAVNAVYPDSARPVNAGMITIDVPLKFRSPEGITRFWALAGALRVVPDAPARVVVNERTGTIVVGEDVRLGTAAISHGNLTISIKETSKTSQPAPFSNTGETRTEKQTDITTDEEKTGVYVVENTTTLHDVARGLNLLGVAPRDMISILQALKRAGALQCELVIM